MLQGLKQYALFLLALFLTNNPASAQCGSSCGPNLIPNPSFENTSACGPSNNLIYTNKSPVADWWGLVCSTCPSSGAGGADNLNSNCAGTNSSLNCGDGKGSIGMFTTYAGRESVQAQLIKPLVAGHQYCFSMRVRSNGISPASNGIGAWFHNKGKLNVDNDNNGNTFLGTGTKLNVSPQVQNPTTTMIGTTCVTVSGTFCATGDESWIVISNFRTDAGTKVGNGTGSGTGGYLIIDELSLKENNCLITTAITSTADSVCPNSCVTLTANPVGNGTYRYKWSPGTAADTLKTFLACPTAATTKYKCVITNSTGCAVTNSLTDSVTIYFKKFIPAPTIKTSTSPTICSGDTITLTCDPPAPGYVWSPGTHPATQSIKVTAAGSYSVTVKHPYSECNTTSAATNVVLNALPVINLSSLKNDSTACDKPTGSITGITATGAPTLTYTWNSDPVQFTRDLMNVGAGSYTLTVTDGNGCKKATTAKISNKPNPPAPMIDLTSATTTICAESDIKLAIKNADPTYTYTWTLLPNTTPVGTGTGLLIKNAKSSDAGVYAVTATKFGCTGASTKITVTVNQLPDTVAVSGTAASICEGAKGVLFVKPPVDPNLTYQWKSPDPSKPVVNNDTISIDKAKLTDAGMYILVATNKLSCSSHDAHIKLQVDSAAKNSKVNLSGSSICEGDEVTITAAIPIAGVTYAVYVKTTIGDSLVGYAPLKVKPHITTKYYMDAVSIKGCRQLAEKDTATVNVYPAPIAQLPTVSDSVICDNDTVIFNVTNPINGVTYKIYDAIVNGNLIGNTPFKTVLHKTTTYYIEAVSSKNCIQITARKAITVHVNALPPKPTISIESKTSNKLCDGSTTKLISSASTNITWSTKETTQAITVTKGGVYTLYFTDANGCKSSNDSVRIDLVQPPKLDVSMYGIDTVKCNATLGGIHGITVNSGTGPFHYNWFDVTDPGKTLGTELNLTAVPTGKYALVVTDKNGCQDKLSNVFIPTKGSIVAHLSADPYSGLAPLHVMATATTSGSNRPQEYVWYLDGKELGKTDKNTTTFPFNNIPFGNHVIQVAVTDSNQCRSVDYITLQVLTPVTVKDVNIFTPNDDGHNDILLFPSEGIQSLRGTIYDRWGIKLFEWAGSENGWDGRDQGGKAVPEGTYYYILYTTDVYGVSHVQNGHVQLLRN